MAVPTQAYYDRLKKRLNQNPYAQAATQANRQIIAPWQAGINKMTGIMQQGGTPESAKLAVANQVNKQLLEQQSQNIMQANIANQQERQQSLENIELAKLQIEQEKQAEKDKKQAEKVARRNALITGGASALGAIGGALIGGAPGSQLGIQVAGGAAQTILGSRKDTNPEMFSQGIANIASGISAANTSKKNKEFADQLKNSAPAIANMTKEEQRTLYNNMEFLRATGNVNGMINLLKGVGFTKAPVDYGKPFGPGNNPQQNNLIYPDIKPLQPIYY